VAGVAKSNSEPAVTLLTLARARDRHMLAWRRGAGGRRVSDGRFCDFMCSFFSAGRLKTDPSYSATLNLSGKDGL